MTPEISLIAPHLLKKGAHIRLDASDGTVEELKRSRTVTWDLIREAGFVLVEGFNAPKNAQSEEQPLTDDREMQFIHQDTRKAGPPNVIQLRFAAGQPARQAATVIGANDELFHPMLRFVLEETNDQAHALIVDIRRRIEQIGIDTIRKDTPYDDRRTWGDMLFSEIPNEVRGQGFPQLGALYGRLAPLLHAHRWRAGQLLFIDDHEMLHGRVPFPGITKASPRGGPLFRDIVPAHQFPRRMRDA